MNTLHTQNLFSTSEAAEILGVSRVTIFRWIKEGIITAIKVGRYHGIPQEELVKHIESRPLNEEDKGKIRLLIDKAIHDYGETIRMLGSE